MRFQLIDKVLSVEAGVRVVASKRLRPEEDYLRDHFPRFPVMPGVLMLEAMFQASAWLVRESEDFENTIVVLKEARNIRYADFVEPNEELVVTAEIIKQDDTTTTLKAEGKVGDSQAVSGRLVLERFRLEDRYPKHGPVDIYARRELRTKFAALSSTNGSANSPH